MIVSLDPINRKMGDVECIYIIDFSEDFGAKVYDNL